MPRAYDQEADDSLRGQMKILQRSIGVLNARLAAIDPGEGDVAAIRRKVLELDQRVGRIERGPLTIPAGEPFSD